MKQRILTVSILLAGLAAGCVLPLVHAQKKKPQLEKPMAGPRATPLRIIWIYITPDTEAQKVAKVQIGREMVVAEKSGPWLRVYANTDIEELRGKDAPEMQTDDATSPPPISGWAQAKGIVMDSTPNADQILMGAAANEESLASDPKGPANAAQSARLLYRRLEEMFPNSPLAPEAAWRSADIEWQIEKADAATLPSARERDPMMHEQMDEDELKKVIKYYPGARWAALAAFDLLDNKLCGNWEGSTQCPEREAVLYEKYAGEFPDGPRTAQALYLAIYRLAVLADIYTANGDDRKADEARNHARELAANLKQHFAGADYAYRAALLVYKLDEGVPVYGIDFQ
ncbi:MAG: tetratricopeptide repeat protein [Terracidiphilus sp.]